MSSPEFPSCEMDNRSSNDRPFDEWSALMAGVEWVEEQSEAALDVMDLVLSERELYVVEAVVFERVPLRELGFRMSLSKTHVARIRDAAYNKIREALKC